MLPSMAGRAGVAGRRCLGVAKDDRRKAGVREVDPLPEGENKFGSEKRTRFARRDEGVFIHVALSEATRGLAGEHITLLLRFGLRRAIGMSIAWCNAVLDQSISLPRQALRRLPNRGCSSFRLLCQGPSTTTEALCCLVLQP